MVDRVVLLSLVKGDAERVKGDDGPEGHRRPRVPVLECRDALRAAGATVELVDAGCDADIDTALALVPQAKIIVAVEAVSQVRAVVRRLLRRYAPPPSARPHTLAADRTVLDLPPIGVLPLAPVGAWLGVPRHPRETAAAVLHGTIRRLDLLRTDAGSVTLDGVLLGAARSAGPRDPDGGAQHFAAQVVVDDAVLSDGAEPLLGIIVANADGYATIDRLPVLTAPHAADGVLNVAVVAPAPSRRFRFNNTADLEVRRATGRAVSVQPQTTVSFVDDGVSGRLTHRRTWWMERAAFAVYTCQDGPVGH